MSDNDKVKGTVEEYNDDSGGSTEYKDLLLTVLNRRDIYIVLVGVLVLHYAGVIDLPFVNQIESMPYYDAIMTVLVGSVVSMVTVWGRVSSIIEEIYAKDWSYLGYVDASGQYFGTWKTDPETLNRMNDEVEFEDGETVENYREGVDKAGRRYGLIKDLEPVNDDSDVAYRLKNIMGWDDVPADDQIISDKTQLKHWMSEVLPEAEQGRKERLSRGALKQKIISDVVTKLVVKYEHATERGVIDMEELYEDVFDAYESVNSEVDDFIRETEISNREATERDTEPVNNQGDKDE